MVEHEGADRGARGVASVAEALGERRLLVAEPEDAVVAHAVARRVEAGQQRRVRGQRERRGRDRLSRSARRPPRVASSVGVARVRAPYAPTRSARSVSMLTSSTFGAPALGCGRAGGAVRPQPSARAASSTAASGASSARISAARSPGRARRGPRRPRSRARSRTARRGGACAARAAGPSSESRERGGERSSASTPSGPSERADHREQLHVAEADAREPDPVVERARASAARSPSPGPVLEAAPERRRHARVHEADDPEQPAAERGAGQRDVEAHRAPAARPPRRAQRGTSTSASASPPSEISSGMIWWSKSITRCGEQRGGEARSHSGVIGAGPWRQAIAAKSSPVGELDHRVAQRDRRARSCGSARAATGTRAAAGCRTSAPACRQRGQCEPGRTIDSPRGSAVDHHVQEGADRRRPSAKRDAGTRLLQRAAAWRDQRSMRAARASGSRGARRSRPRTAGAASRSPRRRAAAATTSDAADRQAVRGLERRG